MQTDLRVKATHEDVSIKHLCVALLCQRVGVDAPVAVLMGGPSKQKAPPPTGHLNIEMPKRLHYALKRKAKAQDVSMNQLCVVLLAGAIDFSLAE